MIISGQEDDDVQVRRCMSGREHIEELKYDLKKLLYWLLTIYTNMYLCNKNYVTFW